MVIIIIILIIAVPLIYGIIKGLSEKRPIQPGVQSEAKKPPKDTPVGQQKYIDDPKDFRRTFLNWTIPIVVISVLLSILGNVDFGDNAAVTIWFLVFIMFFFPAITWGFIYMRRGQKRKAAGVYSALAIGLVSLGVSCFAVYPY